MFADLATICHGYNYTLLFKVDFAIRDVARPIGNMHSSGN